MDAVNDKILRELSGDGRLSNTELAERVGLSPSACLRRVQDLEARGVIKGYRAVLDPEQTGRGFVVYLAVGLGNHTKHAQKTFEQAIAQAEEVRECHNVAGTFEYLLRVETKDMASYKRFHTDRLGTVPEVATLTTYVVMGSPKDQRG